MEPDGDEPAWLSKLHPALRPYARGQRPEGHRESIRIILRFAGPPEGLAGLGFSATAVAGDIATGSVRLDGLGRLAQAAEVIKIEPSGAVRLAP